jgi:hypothetical protein
MGTDTTVEAAGRGREVTELHVWDKRQGAVFGQMLLSFGGELEKIRLVVRT